MCCLITMSQKELHRLEVVQKILDQRLSVVQAAELLGLSRSQVHRLVQAYDRSGAAGLISKKRQKPSNRRHGEDFRNAALELIRERYLDFEPTLAAEKLAENHSVAVSRETLRKWMTQAGIWLSRKQRRTFHQPRLRRLAYGCKIDDASRNPSRDRIVNSPRYFPVTSITYLPSPNFLSPPPNPPAQFPHCPHGNADHEPDVRGGWRCRMAGVRRVRW